jgi:hypothetical protein
MVINISPLSRLINPLKFLHQADFKLNQWLQQKLITLTENRIRLFDSTKSNADQLVASPSIEAIPAQYLDIRSQNIPRLKRVNSLRWLQFYMIGPPFVAQG